MNYEEPFSGIYWGILGVDGEDEAQPIALFRDRADAENYLELLTQNDEIAPNTFDVFRFDLAGTFWNGPEAEDPKVMR